MANEKPRGGELTKEDMAEIEAWLKKSGHEKCPVCSNGVWSIADHLVTPTIFQPGGGLTIGGPAYPMFMVVCRTCGYTQFFNAVVANLSILKRWEAERTSKAKDKVKEQSDG